MIILLASLALQSATIPNPPDELERLRLADQALLDAIALGDRALWSKTLSPDAIYVDENGEDLDRARFLKELIPLPAGVSGKITITDYQGAVHGDVALVRHRDDEREDFHGASLHAEYLTTETWLRQDGVWNLALIHAYVVAVDPPAIALKARTIDSLVGRYTFSDLTLTVRRQGDHLNRSQGSGPPRALLAETSDVLFSPGRPRVRMIVDRDKTGAVLRLIERREGEDLIWQRAPK